MITEDELKRHLDYNPLTGVFVWVIGRRRGAVAGCVGLNGYRYIRIDHKDYLAHRLAWVITGNGWPTKDIDHADGNRDNNAICNLRRANRSQNLANSRKKSTNTSGFKGVNYHKARGRWRARITFNYREIMLGYFDDPEAASRAYEAKAKQLFGEFARAS